MGINGGRGVRIREMNWNDSFMGNGKTWGFWALRWSLGWIKAKMGMRDIGMEFKDRESCREDVGVGLESLNMQQCYESLEQCVCGSSHLPETR